MKRYERLKLEEMSNLFPADTGLKHIVWISTKSGREKHQARIKITSSDGEASIMIWGDPKIKSKRGNIDISAKELRRIILFVELNREILLKHWNGEISSAELGRKIQKVR